MTPDPAACRIGITAGHTVLHVELWHPDWGTAATEALRRSLFGAQVASDGTGTAPDLQDGVAMLEDALGAGRVAAWLGDVRVTDRSPAHAVGIDDLVARVGRMEADAVGPDGRPAYASLNGEDGTARVVLPLSPQVAPACSLHATVTLETDPVDSSDLTWAQIEDRSAAVRDAIGDTVEENHAGILAATVTGDDAVTQHFYLDPGSPAVADRSVLNTLRTVASAWELGDIAVDEESDPAWDAVRAWRV